MTATIPPAARLGRPEVEPPDGVLVRVALGDRGAAPVPPAPTGADITVSLSRAAAAGSAPALEALGYRVVGLSPVPATSPAIADFVVAEAILERHPQWYQEMAAQAEQIFRLAFGPALAAFADVLDVHRG